jgi:hypothetical protein
MAAEGQKRFELENNVQNVEADTIYKYDRENQVKLRDQKPWTKESVASFPCSLSDLAFQQN